jgi:hypothetical protein
MSHEAAQLEYQVCINKSTSSFSHLISITTSLVATKTILSCPCPEHKTTFPHSQNKTAQKTKHPASRNAFPHDSFLHVFAALVVAMLGA